MDMSYYETVYSKVFRKNGKGVYTSSFIDYKVRVEVSERECEKVKAQYVKSYGVLAPIFTNAVVKVVKSSLEEMIENGVLIFVQDGSVEKSPDLSRFAEEEGDLYVFKNTIVYMNNEENIIFNKAPSDNTKRTKYEKDLVLDFINVLEK